MHQHDRVVVDVDDPGIRRRRLGNLVGIVGGGRPVPMSRNWRIPASPARYGMAPPQERPVGADPWDDAGGRPRSSARPPPGRRGSRSALIRTEIGRAAQVARVVRDLDAVQWAEDVAGPYDVIARVRARGMDELGRLVVARIQAVGGITRTLTCSVVKR
jgi:DNA-binding Lrp family transcriptional regulator